MSSHTTQTVLLPETDMHTYVPVPLIEWMSGYVGDTIGYWAEGSYHYAEAEDVTETEKFVYHPNHADACGIVDYEYLVRLTQARRVMVIREAGL